MPFNEKLKKQVRELAGFQCCRCHTFGVEVHHIIPEVEGGSDLIENAAPLCPTCHVDFGANSEKRKTIKEMRDWWYVKIEEMYPSKSVDKGLLEEIYKKVTKLESSQKERFIRQVSQSIQSGAVIKGSQPILQWYSTNDKKRYLFPTIDTYRTWFPEEGLQPKIIKLSDPALASIPIGGNITFRPGARIIRIKNDPKLYAVGNGGILHLISTPALANDIFGEGWGYLIKVIPDYCFVNYEIGSSLKKVEDYDPAIEYVISKLP